jgi:hypothetical protein
MKDSVPKIERRTCGGAKTRQTIASKISSDFITSSFLRAAPEIPEADRPPPQLPADAAWVGYLPNSYPGKPRTL